MTKAFRSALTWEYRRIGRLRSGWALCAGVLAMSLALVAIPNHPFHRQGVFSLQGFAGLDQLLVTFFVIATIMVHRPPQRVAWWPLSTAGILVARTLGAWLATIQAVGLVVAVQWGAAWATNDVHALDPLDPEPVSLTPRYGWLLVLSGGFALVFHAWGQLLSVALKRSSALMTLLVLMFCGFLLSQVIQEHPAFRVLLALVPDLASLSPLHSLKATASEVGASLLYALVHAAAISSLTVVIIPILKRRGVGFDTTADAA